MIPVWTASSLGPRAVRALSGAFRRLTIGRVPELFDADFYRAAHPDVARWGLDPFLHYVRRGAAAGLDPNADFDTAFYRRRSGPTRLDPVRHYLAVGAGRGLDPSPAFSTLMYLTRYPDVARAGINPLLHYRRSGRMEGRIATPLASDPDRWVALAGVSAAHRRAYPAAASPRFALTLRRDAPMAPHAEAAPRLCLVLTLDGAEIDGLAHAIGTFPESGLDALTLAIDAGARPHPPVPTAVLALERCAYQTGAEGETLVRYGEARLWNLLARPRMIVAGPAGFLAVRSE